MKTIKPMIDNLLDLLYPPALYCISCGKIIDETRTYRLCNECMDEVRWISDRTCRICGRRLSGANPGETCFNCSENEHSFDRGYTCTEYGPIERAMVFSLKYDGRTDIAGTIGQIMYDRMLAEYSSDNLRQKYDLVLPVPIHRHKKSIRGFNQAALIAGSLAKYAGLTADDDVLIRVKETHIMRSLGADQRRANIQGAFAIRKHRREDVRHKRILLIDDIYTTGSTVDEISRILKEADANTVDVLTFTAGADMIKS